jgi:hypothetical protein
MAQAHKQRQASRQAIEVQPRAADPRSLTSRLIRFVAKHRRALRRVGASASLLIIAVSATLFVRALLRVDIDKFKSAFVATGGDQLMLAFAFTGLSYLALTGYDGLALRHLGVKVPYWLTALASFASCAVSFTLGFPLVTGGAVRYWLYSPTGMTAGKVAGLTIVAGVTFWLGMGLIVGVGFLFASDAVAEIDRLNPLVNRMIGLVAVAALIAYLGWVASMRWRGVSAFGNFKLPGPVLTLGQMALGVADVCSASAALYVLLPRSAEISYPTFATLYSLAAMLGIASHSPGGLGVFEATIMQGVNAPAGELLASLLMFRGIYYLVPFIGAMALLGGVEATRRWRSIREAMLAPSDD